MKARPSPSRPSWILYDGLCGFCDATVRWVLARDRGGAFRFAPLQGATAAAVRARHPELPPPDETLVLVIAPESATERVLLRSDAALAVLVGLGGLWRVAAIGRLVPRALRDALYRAIARRRRRIAGSLGSCRTPTAAEQARFLDEAPGEPN